VYWPLTPPPATGRCTPLLLQPTTPGWWGTWVASCASSSQTAAPTSAWQGAWGAWAVGFGRDGVGAGGPGLADARLHTPPALITLLPLQCFFCSSPRRPAPARAPPLPAATPFHVSRSNEEPQAMAPDAPRPTTEEIRAEVRARRGARSRRCLAAGPGARVRACARGTRREGRSRAARSKRCARDERPGAGGLRARPLGVPPSTLLPLPCR
jgi:hypothetical protein